MRLLLAIPLTTYQWTNAVTLSDQCVCMLRLPNFVGSAVFSPETMIGTFGVLYGLAAMPPHLSLR